MSNNKSIQAIVNMKKFLKNFENLLEIKMEDWGISEIMSAWVALEDNGRKKLTTDGWLKKAKEMREACDSMNVRCMSRFAREINFLTQEYVKERIDSEDTPHKKISANQPPYWVWEKLIVETKVDKPSNSDDKRLRQLQLHVLLSWSLACGARMAELCRMKVSDVEMKNIHGLKFLKLTIRRGKSSRTGRKPIYYKCFEEPIKVAVCPIKAFLEYCKLELRSGKVFDKPGDLLFHVDPKPKPKSKKPMDSSLFAKSCKPYCEKFGIPFEFWPQGHSGHKCLLNAAYAMQCSKKEIMDIANWSSTQCIQDYVEAPNPDSLNVRLTKMTIEEIDDKCKHARS